MAVAQKALALATSLSRQAEEKYVQVGVNYTDFTTGYVVVLSGITGGVGDGNRIGDKVRAKSLSVRVRMYDNVNSNTCFRLMIVRQRDWTSFPITTVLESDSTLSFINQDKQETFIVLKDLIVQQNSNFANQDRGDTYVFDVPLNYDVWFTGPNSSDYESGVLYAVITADYTSPAGSGVRPVAGEAAMDLKTRLWFTDM